MATEMRLIDANEVERKLRLCIASWCRDCNSNAPVIARTFEDALQRVINAPTVDAVEVVHGRWEQIGYDKVMDRISCSYCKEYWSITDNDTETFNYCPNCGAKMDGEGRDGE